MKEIVEKILQEEEDARKAVDKATADAQNLILKAKKQASEIIDKMSAELKELVARKQKEAKDLYLAQRQQVLDQTKQESINLRKAKEKEISAISKEIFLKVINIKI
jgi:vacuolar-type H+-ATPase subunit H